MTKRPSPFEPTLYRQTKVHLNNYENDGDAMRSIEEKTLKKLLEGSRKLHSILLNDNETSENVNTGQERSNLMQRRVTNYFTVNGKKFLENERVVLSPFINSSKCFYCDKSTSSVYQCAQCLEFYCSTCSLVNYDSFDDKRICLSCA